MNVHAYVHFLMKRSIQLFINDNYHRNKLTAYFALCYESEFIFKYIIVKINNINNKSEFNYFMYESFHGKRVEDE